MNHHLRFVGPAALAAGVILNLTSCSSTKVEPLVANPKHEITYEIRIFEVPVDHKFGDKALEVLTATEGIELIGRIKQEPAFLSTVSGRLNEKKTISNKKDFRYPTEYSPAKYTKPSDGSFFPVTPATPTAFESTKIGTTVSFTSSNETLSIDLDRKAFLGFVNYGTPITSDATDFFGRKVQVIITENRIEKPVFRRYQRKTSSPLRDGEFLIIRNPEAIAVDSGKLPFSEKRPPGFIAMIRATTR